MLLRDVIMWAVFGCSVAAVPTLLVINEWDQQAYAAKGLRNEGESFVPTRSAAPIDPAVGPTPVAGGPPPEPVIQEPLRTGTLGGNQTPWIDPVASLELVPTISAATAGPPLEQGSEGTSSVATSGSKPNVVPPVAALAIPPADGPPSPSALDPAPEGIQAVVLPLGRVARKGQAPERRPSAKPRPAEFASNLATPSPATRAEPSSPPASAAKPKPSRKPAKPLNLMQWSLP